MVFGAGEGVAACGVAGAGAVEALGCAAVVLVVGVEVDAGLLALAVTTGALDFACEGAADVVGTGGGSALGFADDMVELLLGAGAAVAIAVSVCGFGAGILEVLFGAGAGIVVGLSEATCFGSAAAVSTGLLAGLATGASAGLAATGMTAGVGFFSTVAAAVMPPGTLRNFTTKRLFSGTSW